MFLGAGVFVSMSRNTAALVHLHDTDQTSQLGPDLHGQIFTTKFEKMKVKLEASIKRLQALEEQEGNGEKIQEIKDECSKFQSTLLRILDDNALMHQGSLSCLSTVVAKLANESAEHTSCLVEHAGRLDELADKSAEHMSDLTEHAGRLDEQETNHHEAKAERAELSSKITALEQQPDSNAVAMQKYQQVCYHYKMSAKNFHEENETYTHAVQLHETEQRVLDLKLRNLEEECRIRDGTHTIRMKQLSKSKEALNKEKEAAFARLTNEQKHLLNL